MNTRTVIALAGKGEPRGFAAALLGLAAAVSLTSSIASAQSFTPLGYLPGGTYVSFSSGVNADGSVVVGGSSSTAAGDCFGCVEAFRWTAMAGMVPLGFLPGEQFWSVATGVSSDGLVVVGYSNGQAFRWTEAGGMQGLGDLPGGRLFSSASGVNADGSVVVGVSSSALGIEAFRWTAATGMQPLGDLPGGDFESYAEGVSADGSVVIGTSGSTITDLDTEAIRWTNAEGPQGLSRFPGADFSAACGVNSDGSVVVGWSGSVDAGVDAFRWTEDGGMQSLGNPIDWGSQASGVSGNGWAVVGVAIVPVGGGIPGSDQVAFVWTPALGMVNLRDHLIDRGITNLDGWALTWATAVSADGTTIVGEGYDGKSGKAWMARLGAPPCPADFNGDTVANTQDFFDFVTAFFSLQPSADFNRDTTINSLDFSDFLAAFFAEC